jgi:hypothetical protein
VVVSLGQLLEADSFQDVRLRIPEICERGRFEVSFEVI